MIGRYLLKVKLPDTSQIRWWLLGFGSQVEIIQAVGRAIRKVRGAEVQTKGTIVIPVFIEDGDEQEASIEASNFKPVWDVLKALRAHDEVLADKLD